MNECQACFKPNPPAASICENCGSRIEDLGSKNAQAEDLNARDNLSSADNFAAFVLLAAIIFGNINSLLFIVGLYGLSFIQFTGSLFVLVFVWALLNYNKN